MTTFAEPTTRKLDLDDHVQKKPPTIWHDTDDRDALPILEIDFNQIQDIFVQPCVGYADIIEYDLRVPMDQSMIEKLSLGDLIAVRYHDKNIKMMIDRINVETDEGIDFIYQPDRRFIPTRRRWADLHCIGVS